MKSLAHPDWPYTGTCWEWHGFAKKAAIEVKEPVKAWPMYVNPDASDVTIYQRLRFGPELS